MEKQVTTNNIDSISMGLNSLVTAGIITNANSTPL